MKIGDDAMHQVPQHIKHHVDRIIREYQRLCNQGHKVALQLYRNNRIYSGVETTKYYLDEVRKFRKLLDQPKGSMFIGPEMEVNKRIYNKICEFYKPLSPQAIKRITCSTSCQGQLEDALRSAIKKPHLAADIKHLTWFITNANTLSWNHIDENVVHKQFKLVRTESAFEKLFSTASAAPLVEITETGSFHVSNIRIAVQIKDIEAIYRKQNKLREYKNFWNSAVKIDEFDLEHTVYNMWNNVAETGIYYVYIPEC